MVLTPQTGQVRRVRRRVRAVPRRPPLFTRFSLADSQTSPRERAPLDRESLGAIPGHHVHDAAPAETHDQPAEWYAHSLEEISLGVTTSYRLAVDVFELLFGDALGHWQ